MTPRERKSLAPGLLLLLIAFAQLACGGEDGVAPDPDPFPELEEIAGLNFSPNSPIRVFAGNGENALGEEGVSLLEASFSNPKDLTITDDGTVYFVDWNNHRIRRLDADGKVRTVVGSADLGDAITPSAALEIGLNHPTHLIEGPDGTFYISAWHNSKVIRWDPVSNQVTGVCGTGQRDFGGEGVPAAGAVLNLPVGTVFDDDGNLLVADMANHCIRTIEAEGVADGTGLITTLYGRYEYPRYAVDQGLGYEGDGGPATEARFNGPTGQQGFPRWGMFRTDAGELYISDSVNQAIRKIDTNGTITTVAGGNDKGFSGDGGPATAAQLRDPADIVVDAQGNLYIADTSNHCVRVVTTEGIIHTLVGVGGERGEESVEGTPAGYYKMYWPFGLELDAAENLYIADMVNCRYLVLENLNVGKAAQQ